MPLGTDVGLSPGDVVLDGDPVPSPKRGRSPTNFRPIFTARSFASAVLATAIPSVCLTVRPSVRDT